MACARRQLVARMLYFTWIVLAGKNGARRVGKPILGGEQCGNLTEQNARNFFGEGFFFHHQCFTQKAGLMLTQKAGPIQLDVFMGEKCVFFFTLLPLIP